MEMEAKPETVEGVADVLAGALGIGARRAELTVDTELFGVMPELDSIAVLTLIVGLEEHFGVEIDAGEVTAENFGRMGPLSDFVQSLLDDSTAG